ncbi:MAG: phosphoadenosine phosphosulfate reductase family protein [Acetobacter sp.]|jgi:3'-phosphoadenosine 5'-phosphosulfate sulfotransferase (PAPS reductase)/FAD synthetase|nr:phosphoadenosine phosphosulfate reductase family protein [Acetobacter sp.]MCI1485782.1 phosphoadenosine phosphosulfate reductase family protein [Acetobacter sp.]MCI1529838.1 phosphoadenosine phosphosulfate reductase family protein [Acetobacter sp.]MCI1587495.1 phosphoadenosine phosphosulfate reductase family protein [Acetobacter sp.]MCI1601711.1 phosphoadenosine phosphosulfate reductase family protein [Acetobacter sp.]
MSPDLSSYENIIVAVSGGKDGTACLLALLEAGAPVERIKLWHHKVDGAGLPFMDWPSTEPYVAALAQDFSLPIYRSWREGGFEREMLRDREPTAAVVFETPDGVMRAGGQGPEGTRLRFPQVSSSLSVRWCSASLKVDVADRALRAQDRFLNRRTLFVTGERAEESPARARYAPFEPHRTDTRNGRRRRRHVDHWRPVHKWSEAEVWAILKRWSVTPATPYKIGFSRLSCAFCIFADAHAFATLQWMDATKFARLVDYEEHFGCTIKRDRSLMHLVRQGRVFEAARSQPALVKAALSDRQIRSVFTEEWPLPAGAFGNGEWPA